MERLTPAGAVRPPAGPADGAAADAPWAELTLLVGRGAAARFAVSCSSVVGGGAVAANAAGSFQPGGGFAPGAGFAAPGGG